MKAFIFLDVDGVLIPYNHYTKEYDNKRPTAGWAIRIPGETLANLKRIVDVTGASLILSSSWRKDKDDKECSSFQNLCNQLKEFGLSIEDCTPIDSSGIRGKEIREFLEKIKISENKSSINNIPYIILDDEIVDIDRYHGSFHIVQPKYGNGLSDKYADDAIWKLSRMMKGCK